MSILFAKNYRSTLEQNEMQEPNHCMRMYLAAQANGILYCPSLLQAVLAFFSTFRATWPEKREDNAQSVLPKYTRDTGI